MFDSGDSAPTSWTNNPHHSHSLRLPIVLPSASINSTGWHIIHNDEVYMFEEIVGWRMLHGLWWLYYSGLNGFDELDVEVNELASMSHLPRPDENCTVPIFTGPNRREPFQLQMLKSWVLLRCCRTILPVLICIGRTSSSCVCKVCGFFWYDVNAQVYNCRYLMKTDLLIDFPRISICNLSKMASCCKCTCFSFGLAHFILVQLDFF